MNKERTSRILLLVFLIICFSILCYKIRFPYRISKKNIKSVYCEYWDNTGTHKIPVNDSDKKVILPEISKMKNNGSQGQIGTLNYNFVIEQTNSSKFVFYECSAGTVTLQSDKGGFYRNIAAPKSAEFIHKFITDNKINPY